MQLIVVGGVYVQAKTYARADDRCCHRIQRELGPAGKRDILINCASSCTPFAIATSRPNAQVMGRFSEQ